MTTEQLEVIENKIGYAFVDRQLLATAFTHSSYAKRLGLRDNERMEFLGDAILDMVVSEYLFARFPDCDAGELSTMRSNVVSSEALRPVVCALDVVRHLQVANGALSAKQKSKKIEADLYESIVSAIYLDGGLDAAKRFILATLSPLLSSVGKAEQKDSKTLLQEYCQGHKIPNPEYRLAQRIGADNCPTYKYDLYVNDVYMCSGEGSSKKAAEQDAAKKLVTEWRID